MSIQELRRSAEIVPTTSETVDDSTTRTRRGGMDSAVGGETGVSRQEAVGSRQRAESAGVPAACPYSMGDVYDRVGARRCLARRSAPSLAWRVGGLGGGGPHRSA